MSEEGVGGDRQMELFERAHSSEMSMQDFATWLQTNVGTGLRGALEITALSLCGDVISQDISKATLRLRERLGNGTSKVVEPNRHEIAGLLALEPNKRMTWGMFVEMMVYWSCFDDNAYAGIFRQNDGTVIKLIPFQSGRVQEMVAGEDIFYDVSASTQHEQALLGTISRRFHEDDMIHVRTRFLDGMDGYSTITAGKQAIETMKNLAEYRKNLFGDEGQMRGVFTRSKEEFLPDENFNRLRQQFKILMNRFRQLTEPIILEGGFKFESISSNPQEMELTKQFESQVIEVCRMFRMPPHKIFMLDGSKYENLETQEKMYVSDTLIPRAKRFEEMFGKMLLSRKDRLKYFFEFDREEMTLRDTKVQTERIIKGAERGIFLTDEARAAFGANPLPGGAGQSRLIPTNMSLVDNENNVIIGGVSTAKDSSSSDNQDGADETDPDAETETEKGVLRLVKI